MQSVKEVVSESVGTAWIPSWGMVSLISSCQNSSWWRLQLCKHCVERRVNVWAVPSSRAGSQAGIPSLLPHLGTCINEMATLAWVAPPKEDGVIWSSLSHSEALLCCSWWRQSCGSVQLKALLRRHNRHIITVLCWIASWQKGAWFSCSVISDGWLQGCWPRCAVGAISWSTLHWWF